MPTSTPIFQAQVNKGKVEIEDRGNFELWVGQFEGKKVEVIVRKKVYKRTTGKPNEEGNQNGWYWAIVLPTIAKHSGETVERLHEQFTAMFAPYTRQECFGVYLVVKIRTHEMSREQFTEFVESIRVFVADFGIVIPDPKKVDY